MTARQCLSGFVLLSLVLSGMEAGEEASRLDLEMSIYFGFDYRPAVVTRLIRQTPPLFSG